MFENSLLSEGLNVFTPGKLKDEDIGTGETLFKFKFYFNSFENIEYCYCTLPFKDSAEFCTFLPTEGCNGGF